MSEPTLPPEDIEVANRRGLSFEATWRDKRGQRWLTLQDGIPTLPEAFALARAAHRPQVALWVKRLDGGGSKLYWTSEHAELFNSLVLQEGYS